MFVEYGAARYRVLLQCEEGAWMINCDHPTTPVFISSIEFDKCVRIEAPDFFTFETDKKQQMSKAVLNRIELIRPLLHDERYIVDRHLRRDKIIEIAQQKHTTERRILSLYCKYLARGSLQPISKPKPVSRNTPNRIFDAAIEKYYFSAARHSLKSAYDCMLLEHFTDASGKLIDHPSWKSFENYYYRNGYHRKSNRAIARDGLSNYQRNHRQLGGSAVMWKHRIGSYQMDATQADIYLVSSFDRSLIIGRPYIYLAVDTVTELIAGIYVGLESGETAVMACLANAAADKVAYCAAYGIEIDAMQWPSRGVPAEIITDKGREFEGKQIDAICARYGMERESLPPFRPDQKGLVEKSFDLLQNRYKSLLRGKGVIEPDAQERWSVDYRSQAALTLEMYTQLVIRIVLYLNGRPLKNYPATSEMLREHIALTPIGIWHWLCGRGCSALLQVDQQEVYCMSLPRKEAKVTRHGIVCNGFTYINPDLRRLLEKMYGKKMMVAYDSQNISQAYLIYENAYIPLMLAPAFSCCNGFNQMEGQQYLQAKKSEVKNLNEQDVQARVDLLKQTDEIIRQAECPYVQHKQTSDDIAANREIERRKLT